MNEKPEKREPARAARGRLRALTTALAAVVRPLVGYAPPPPHPTRRKPQIRLTTKQRRRAAFRAALAQRMREDPVYRLTNRQSTAFVREWSRTGKRPDPAKYLEY